MCATAHSGAGRPDANQNQNRCSARLESGGPQPKMAACRDPVPGPPLPLPRESPSQVLPFEKFPPRGDVDTVPLIEASAAYPALENAILDARTEALLGFRILSPRTKLRTERARSQGLETWRDLIADAVGRGVNVRILMTDFEPIMANDLHQRTWEDIAAFRMSVPAGAAGHLQVIAALHEGEFGPVARWLLWPLVWSRLQGLHAEATSSRQNPKDFRKRSPGLWRMLSRRRRSDAFEIRSWPPPRMWPVTYHQKIAVFDGAVTILGGLDVDERRFDNPDHAQPSDRTWHDVSLRSSGPIAADLRRHFQDCWNREVPRFNARLTQLGAPRDDLPLSVTRLSDPSYAVSHDDGPANDGTLQVLRTRSRRSRSPFAVGPKAAITEIEAAHINQIGAATDLIYLESQFFRSEPIIAALERAAGARPDLRLILVVPAAPEDVAFDGNTGADARHGEWRQVQGVDRLRAAFGDRFGAFCLVKDRPAADSEETEHRRFVAGRAIIYLHSKVSIFDGRTAIVSSANLNGRSMQWDTECGVLWQNESGVERFQRQLWANALRDHLTRDDGRSGDAALALWRRAAEDVAHGRFEGASCPLIAHYPLEWARSFAQRIPFVPSNLI